MTNDPSLHQWVASLTEQEYDDLLALLKPKRGKRKTQLQMLLEGERSMDSFVPELEKSMHNGKLASLSTLKRQLESKILEFLVGRHRENNKLETIRKGVKQILVALERNQDDRAQQLVEAWKLEAQEMEQPDLELEILKLERRILKKQRMKGVEPLLEHNLLRADKALTQYTAMQQLMMVYDELFIRVRQEFRVRAKTEEAWLSVREVKVMQYDVTSLSFDGRRNYWACLATISKLRGDSRAYYDMMLKLNQEWNGKPQLQIPLRREFRVSLANLLSAGHESRQFGHFPDILSQVASLQTDTPDELQERQQTLDLYGLLFLLYTPQKDKLDAESKRLFTQLKSKESGMISSTGMAIWFNLAVSFLVLGDHDRCASSLSKIHALSKSGHRKDVRFGADFLRILLLINQEETEEALLKVEALLKLMRDHEHLDEGEKLALNGLRSYLTVSEKEKGKRLRMLEMELKAHLDARLHSAPGLHECLYWIQSVILKKPMLEVLQMK